MDHTQSVVTTRKLIFFALYHAKACDVKTFDVRQVAAAGIQVDVHTMSHALLQGISKVSYKRFAFPYYMYSVCVPHCPTLELNFKPMIIF